MEGGFNLSNLKLNDSEKGNEGGEGSESGLFTAPAPSAFPCTLTLCKEKLRELELFSLKKRKFQSDFTTLQVLERRV